MLSVAVVEQVNDGNGPILELLKNFANIVQLKFALHSQNVHLAAFHEQVLALVRVRSVRLIAHLEPVRRQEVVARDHEKHCLLLLLAVLKCHV